MTALLKPLVWWASIAALAVAALFLQFDIESVQTPALADKVPAFFQSRAATVLAQRAIEDEDWAGSSVLALRTLLRRPVPASSLSNLAVSRTKGGTVYDDTVVAPMIEASARGWRDPVGQISAIAFALETGKAAIAAQRMDALWRVQALNGGAQEVMKAAMADPAVRDALAARYAAGVPWSADFIAWATDNLPPDQFAQFLARAAARGAPADCAAISAAATRMILAGQPDGAAGIWGSLCSGSRKAGSGTGPETGPETGVPGDIGLQPSAAIAGPFDWTYPTGSTLDRVFLGHGRVRYRGYDLVRARLARRYAALKRGNHVLSADIEGMAPVLTVACIANGKPSRPDAVALVSGKAHFTLPVSDCAVQQILLEVGRGEGTIGNVTLN